VHRSFDTVDSHQTPAATTTHHCGRRRQAFGQQATLTASPHRLASYTPPTGGIQPDSKQPGVSAARGTRRPQPLGGGAEPQTPQRGPRRGFSTGRPSGRFSAVCGCGGPTGVGSGRIQGLKRGCQRREETGGSPLPTAPAAEPTPRLPVSSLSLAAGFSHDCPCLIRIVRPLPPLPDCWS